MISKTEFVLIEQQEAILRVQLNRPDKKNALLPEMYDAVREALEHADADDSIRVVFLTGTDGSFCAGNDLNEFLNNPSSQAPMNFIKQIAITQTPIVAAVTGIAVGVGVTMLLHCDLVYAVPEAVFNFAFIDLGIVPEAASSYLVPQLVGHRRAAELLMLGEKFDAPTAVDMGLVNAMIDADQLEATAWAKAERLASKPPQALRLTKQLLKRNDQDTIIELMEHELNLMAERLQSDEVREIMQAFFARKAKA